MENEQNKLVLLAEDVLISEESKLNPVFLTIDVKMCDSGLNKNREGVTEEFIADVVNRSHDFDCLPFYADVENLMAQNYEKLGHLYNRVLRTFGTKMIGSMTEFYSVKDTDGITSLYGKIRVPKREREICLRLVDLYEQGHFAVSFEVVYDAREVILKDGGTFIDASDNASLTGLCLVWNPACSDAYAFDMVAEHSEETEIVAESEEQISERGETELKDNEMAEVVEEIAEVQAEETEVVAEVTEETQEVAVAEGEGGSGSGSGASGSSGGEDEDEDEDEDTDEAVIQDAADEEGNQRRTEAETQEAQAELIEHSVHTHESVEQCPYSGEAIHVVEVTERMVETLDDANTVIAEQKTKIAELETRIAQLEEIEVKYNAIMAEAEEKALAEKRMKAQAFAERQGLNIQDDAVAEAVHALDYTKIAELTMAQETKEVSEELAVDEKKITLAGFVEFDINTDEYGGLLKRRNK